MRTASKDKQLAFAFISAAFLFFFIGTICGLLQGLVRGGVMELPNWLNYYKVLTTHGVSLALLFTTYFIYGFLFAGIHRTMGEMSAKVRATGWIGFWMMLAGTLLAVAMVSSDKATVLYTFYAPLKASPYFYIGLVKIKRKFLKKIKRKFPSKRKRILKCLLGGNIDKTTHLCCSHPLPVGRILPFSSP